MKRKIAAIFAADVAGYSRLVAEDEEETLRRLASYRAVMDDFIGRAGGRIFNTAGDAVLAEFSSAVEAVRCAIDIQESLRTRNLAYPASRQMNFRIGITVGDVVERDGDLLGDGVNIAARLEGIAPVGGICISRTVHEQVANKLSVQFADIGEQQVKNIPTPVHAYKIEMRPDEPRAEPHPAKKAAQKPTWVIPAAVGAACIAVLVIAAVAYRTGRSSQPQLASQTNPPASTATGPGASVAPTVVATQPPAAPVPSPPQAVALVPEMIPIVSNRVRATIRDEYMGAPDHKALAISAGPIGLITGQADDDAAKAAALDICQKRADAQPQPRKCELYALGNTVVYARGRPPMPPAPWYVHDPSVERPLAVNDIPLIQDNRKAGVEKNYLAGHKSKALVIGPAGGDMWFINQESADEAARRALELCGINAGVPCQIVAVDDNFIVPIPMTMKAVGLFRPSSTPAVAPALRGDLANRLANSGGWTAVATGTDGRPGVITRAANEQAAIDGALADCAKQDRSCRVIAIGPFTVEPK
jgi:class 3 adenylate cyclase